MGADTQAVAKLPALGDTRQPTVTDQIFDLLYERVVNLTLPPGAKLSEAEVAAQMGVSRQPVRDAFYRLSQMGFIQIRRTLFLTTAFAVTPRILIIRVTTGLIPGHSVLHLFERQNAHKSALYYN